MSGQHVENRKDTRSFNFGRLFQHSLVASLFVGYRVDYDDHKVTHMLHTCSWSLRARCSTADTSCPAIRKQVSFAVDLLLHMLR